MNTYNVTGTLPNGVYVALTVQAASFEEAISKAKEQEPSMTVTNVVRTGVANA